MRSRWALALAALVLAPAACAAAPGAEPITATRVTPSAATGRIAGCTDASVRSVTRVGTARELTAALRTARPGHVIELAPGTYAGHFVAAVPARQRSPIVLRGGPGAVLSGGTDGYALHLVNADWWTLCGFTVSGGAKGIMLDETSHASLVRLHVSGTGQEAVHLRTNSSDNLVRDLAVDATGLTDPQFGEGIYVGSAVSNWCRYTACAEDASDRNQIIGNAFGGAVSAENIDVKEGTVGGLVEGNRFDGTGTVAADSWLDVKGNDWVIRNNTGVRAPQDGMQVHAVAPGWARGNTFEGNVLGVDASGYGIKVDRRAVDTVVACDNQAVGAGSGLSNVECRTG